MKKLYLLIILTIIVVAAPITQEKALELFDKIKQSEYSWAVQQWNMEMKIKTTSRTSTRSSVWDNNQNPSNTQSNASLINRDIKVDVDNKNPNVDNNPTVDPHK